MLFDKLINGQYRYFLLAICGLFFSASSQATLNVFACEPEWAALANVLGGEKLSIFSATTSMQDPHYIQARPSLIAKARRADLLICTGAELEAGWLPLLIRKAANTKIQPGNSGHFFAADFVSKLGVPEQLDRSHGDVHGEGNPHIHTSPKYILRVATELKKRLIQIDESNQDFYQKKFDAFEKRWLLSMQRWEQQAAVLKDVKIVAHHEYWVYLNDWTGMHLLATLEPVPGVSPGSSHLVSLKKRIANNDVKMIMHVAYVNDRAATWLSEQSGVPVVSIAATVDFQNGESLTAWFDGVIEKLVVAANK